MSVRKLEGDLGGRECGLDERARGSCWIRFGCDDDCDDGDGPFMFGSSKWLMNVVGSAGVVLELCSRPLLIIMEVWDFVWVYSRVK